MAAPSNRFLPYGRQTIDEDDVEAVVRALRSDYLTTGPLVAEFERAYLRELLSRTGWNISEAARLAGKERSRLSKLAKKHGLLRSQVPDHVERP